MPDRPPDAEPRPRPEPLAGVLARGVARSLACAFVALAAVMCSSFGLPAAVVAVTACFLWVPLTVLERRLARRPLRKQGAVIGLILTWLLVGPAVPALDAQLQYVAALARGAGPAAAFGSIEALHEGALVVIVWLYLGAVLSSLVAGRIAISEPRKPAGEPGPLGLSLLFVIAQPALATFLPCLLFAVADLDPNPLLLSASAVGAGITLGGPAVIVLWLLTAVGDGLFERLWAQETP